MTGILNLKADWPRVQIRLLSIPQSRVENKDWSPADIDVGGEYEVSSSLELEVYDYLYSSGFFALCEPTTPPKFDLLETSVKPRS